jgi:hypothetical protein
VKRKRWSRPFKAKPALTPVADMTPEERDIETIESAGQLAALAGYARKVKL